MFFIKKGLVSILTFSFFIQSCSSPTNSGRLPSSSDYQISPTERINLYEPAASALLKAISFYSPEKLTPKEKLARIEQIQKRYHSSFNTSLGASGGGILILSAGSMFDGNGSGTGGFELNQLIVSIGVIVAIGAVSIGLVTSSSGESSFRSAYTKKYASALKDDPTAMRDIDKRVSFFAKTFDLSLESQKKLKEIYIQNVVNQLLTPLEKIKISNGVSLSLESLKKEITKSKIFSDKQQKLVDRLLAYEQRPSLDVIPSVGDLFTILENLRTSSIALAIQIPSLEGEIQARARLVKANADLEALKLAKALENETNPNQ